MLNASPRVSILRRLTRALRPDEGDAVILVVLAIVLLTLIPISIFTTSLAQLPIAQGNQDYQRALAAAEAGVSDYVNRLNQSSLSQSANYWQYNASNPPPDGNPAFSGWAPVQGSTGEYFHYSVNASDAQSQGTVYLTSTGVSVHGTTTTYRTITVGLRTLGFLDYLLLTNTMMVSPYFAPFLTRNSGGEQMSSQTAQDYCAYQWDQPNPYTGGYGPDMNQVGPNGHNYGYGYCAPLINYYVSGQVFNGGVFTNDIFYINGQPTFNGAASSSTTRTSGDPTHPYWYDPICSGTCSGDGPITAHAGDPSYHSPLAFPSQNTALLSEAEHGGCVYAGPTSIVISGTTMTVTSPETPTSGFSGPGCMGSGSLNLPSNGVIYVENLPSSLSCNGQVVLDQTTLPCSQGDALIQGTLHGQLTIGADNNIDIAGDLIYAGCAANGTTDVLGLVANNFIEVTSHFGTTNTTTDTCTDHPSNDPVIYAAMLTLNQSFAVQNFYNTGQKNLGTIYFTGSMAGQFADIEGTFDSNTGQITNGYLTNYTYDARLQYLTPPYYLSPLASQWKTITFSEIQNPSSLPPLPS